MVAVERVLVLMAGSALASACAFFGAPSAQPRPLLAAQHEPMQSASSEETVSFTATLPEASPASTEPHEPVSAVYDEDPATVPYATYDEPEPASAMPPPSGAGSGDKVSASCSLAGKNLWGKVKVVDAFPDFEVKVVDAFPDLKVKEVDAFPDACGKWKFVDAFPDFTVKFVDAFPDFTIKKVDAFPGVP